MFAYTEKKLAKEIGAIARSLEPTISHTYRADSQEVELRRDEDAENGPRRIFLGNIFSQVSGLPKTERHASIEGFLREAMAADTFSPDALAASLMFRARTKYEVSLTRRYMEMMEGDVTRPPLLPRGDLLLEIVADQGMTVSTVTRENLAECGLTEEEAAQVATASLNRLTQSAQWERVTDSVWISPYQDDYDFTRLVAASGGLVLPFEKPAIVFAPSQSVCLVTDNPTPATLTAMVEIGNEYAADHRPFSQLFYTCDSDDAWTVWQPDPASEESKIAHLRVLSENAQQYGETKHLLEQTISDDVFFASYEFYGDEESMVSYCVCTVGIPTYLPRTDCVAIVDDERTESEQFLGQVDWQTFQACLSDDGIEKLENFEPDWFRVVKPLSAAQKEKLAKLAKPFG